MHNTCRLTALIFAFALITTPTLAFDSAVFDVIEKARHECRSLENGMLEAGENAVVEIDLTGDGRMNKLVDASELTCTTAVLRHRWLWSDGNC